MGTPIYIGVDGGASKCLVRIEDSEGAVLGEVISGPASIKQSVTQSWQAIQQGIEAILSPLGIYLDSSDYQFHLGVGIAGTELKAQCKAFLATPHSFKKVVLASDAHVACLGAHAGADGAIIAIGTGVIGWQIENQQTTRVSGWGFPHDDQGGGAWLGFEAMRETLQYLDGRSKGSQLVEMIQHFFEKEHIDCIAFSNQANATDYASLAPIVLRAASEKDRLAIALLERAANAIEAVGNALASKAHQTLPLSLVGGLAESLRPFFSPRLMANVRPAQGNAAQGAVYLVHPAKLATAVV